MAAAADRDSPAVRPAHVLVLSASMAAGHDGVARELARRLQQQGATATVLDYLRMLPLGLGALCKLVYRSQLRWPPRNYEWLYSVIDGRGPSPVSPGCSAGQGAGACAAPLGRVEGGTVLLHDSDCTSAPGAWRSTHDAVGPLLAWCAGRGLDVGPVREHGLPE